MDKKAKKRPKMRQIILHNSVNYARKEVITCDLEISFLESLTDEERKNYYGENYKTILESYKKEYALSMKRLAYFKEMKKLYEGDDTAKAIAEAEQNTPAVIEVQINEVGK